MRFFLTILIFLISCNQEKKHIIIESAPKSANQIKALGFYEYPKIGVNTTRNQTVFFSNVKPDYILKDRKNYPLGRLRSYFKESSEVLKYFDKELNNEFIYYQFRNDSLISRVYLLDNSLRSDGKVTKLNEVIKLMDSLKIKYTSNIKNVDLLREKFNYNIPSTDDIILIDDKYPAIVHVSSKLFYIEVFYNKVDYHNSIWALER